MVLVAASPQGRRGHEMTFAPCLRQLRDRVKRVVCRVKRFRVYMAKSMLEGLFHFPLNDAALSHREGVG